MTTKVLYSYFVLASSYKMILYDKKVISLKIDLSETHYGKRKDNFYSFEDRNYINKFI